MRSYATWLFRNGVLQAIVGIVSKWALVVSYVGYVGSVINAKEQWVKDAVLIKPCLPYVDAAWLLRKLAEWRRANGITAGSYRTNSCVPVI